MPNTFLHLHSGYSLNDGVSTAEEVRAIAERLNSTAVALTDHGTMMGVEEFFKVFSESSVKFIPGVEAYVSASSDGKREHLVLLPMDTIGYKAIYKGVTKSNQPDQKFPIFTIDLLRGCFGPGTDGHGHVIALSACMQGVLCSELRFNETLESTAVKIERKSDRIELDYNEYLKISALLSDAEEQLTAITERRNYLNSIRNRSFVKKQKDVEKLKGTDSYNQAYNNLVLEMAETEKAKKEYIAVKEQESAVGKTCSSLRSKVRDMEERIDKKQAYNDEAAAVRARKLDNGQLYLNAKAKAELMIEIFGSGNFYAELQYHGIPAEAEVFPQILILAKELGLELVATNDAHIPTNSVEDRKRRQLLASLRFNTWKEERVGDNELYMKSDEELEKMLVQILPTEDVKQAIQNNDKVASRCNVAPKHGNHYPRWNGKETAEERLWKLCEEGKKRIYGDKWTEEHQKRLEHEMKVIKQLDVCDYLAIVQDFLEYGRLLGRIDLEDPRYIADPYNFELLEKLADGRVGMGIGFGRGSAVGSLVCYLTGITGADPVKYNLLFERFLSTERVTMPDIDSDFSPAIRGKVLEYVKHKYGETAVCGIMNCSTQKAKAAIRNTARLHGSRAVIDLVRKRTAEELESDGDEENSEVAVRVPKDLKTETEKITKRYLEYGAAINSLISDEPRAKIKNSLEEIKRQFGMDRVAMAIVNDALLVEGSFVGIGLHAAGVIIADNGDVSEYTPLMYSKDGMLTTQCDKRYCEELGLLKMDFLGLRNLSIITETLRYIERDTGKKLDVIRDIPLDDAAVYSEIFAKGNTDSVFQFESDGMKELLKRFKPTCMEHLMLLNAMFRPGPSQYIDAVCEVKAGKTKPKYIIPEMESIFGDTYGKPLYQEQIMALFNRFAGFTLGGADLIRKYMSKKETEKMMLYKPKFIDGLVEHGAKLADAEALWEELVDFSNYAFNKSHACAYAVTAYYTAYLKYHYPKEYLSAALNDTESDKIGRIIADARNYGVQVLPPDVNISMERFEPHPTDNTIRYGLADIKLVASAASRVVKARDDGPFKGYADFMERTGCSKRVAESLLKSGAMDCLSTQETTIKAWRLERLREIEADQIPENDMMTLIQEKEMLGAFLSVNPTQNYESKHRISQITKAYAGWQIVAVVTNFQIKTTKNGDEYAIFTMEDETGSLDVRCWPKYYENCKDILKDNCVLSITVCSKKDRRSEDGALTYEVTDVSIPTLAIRALILTCEHGKAIGNYLPICMKYADKENGIPIYALHGKKQIPVLVKVRPAILNDPAINHLLTVEG